MCELQPRMHGVRDGEYPLAFVHRADEVEVSVSQAFRPRARRSELSTHCELRLCDGGLGPCHDDESRGKITSEKRLIGRMSPWISICGGDGRGLCQLRILDGGSLSEFFFF